MPEVISSVPRFTRAPEVTGTFPRVSPEIFRYFWATLHGVVISMAMLEAETAKAQDSVPSTKDGPASAQIIKAPEADGMDNMKLILSRIENEIRALDSDEFAVREQANRRIHELIGQLLQTVNPLPKHIREVLNPRDPNGQFNRKRYSLEQCYRLVHALHDADEQSFMNPERIMPTEGSLKDIAEAMCEQTGFRITVDETLQKALSTSHLTVQNGENEWGNVIRMICRTFDATVEPGPGADELRIVPRTKGSRDMIFDRHMMVLLGQNESGQWDVDIRQTPQSGSMVSIDDIHAYDASQIGSVSVTPLGINGEWTFGTTSYKPVRSKAAPTRTADLKNAGHVILRGAMASRRESKPLDLTLNEWTTIGPQEFRAEVKQVEGADSWEVVIHASIFGDVPWPQTPVPVDTKTYGMLDSATYELRGAKGERVLPSGPVRTHIDQRRATITIPVDQKPVSANVSAYTQLELDAAQKVRLRER